MTDRNNTKKINIGNVTIGGGEKIAIQSMTNTETSDIKKTVNQILELEKAGCEIIRCTVPDEESACAIKDIKEQIHIPLVADIHFDYKMAIKSIENGADKIRINPGNIGDKTRVKEVVDCAKEHRIPIRIGVNSGSLEKDILEKYNGVTANGLALSAMRNIELLESMDFSDIVVSIKSSNVMLCTKAHELLSQDCKYPVHVGITESGTINGGTIKSSLGLGAILSRGIGDTIRVSLSGDPVNEVYLAKEILRDLGLRKEGIEVISCPTCGRTKINLISLANEVESLTKKYNHLNIKVAVMGCVVNGPGEGKEADLGIAGGIGEGLLIKKGEIVKKIPESQFINTIKYELDNWK